MVSTETSLLPRTTSDFNCLLVGVDCSGSDGQRSKKVSLTLFAPVLSFEGTFRVTPEAIELFDFLPESPFGADNLS